MIRAWPEQCGQARALQRWAVWRRLLRIGEHSTAAARGEAWQTAATATPNPHQSTVHRERERGRRGRGRLTRDESGWIEIREKRSGKLKTKKEKVKKLNKKGRDDRTGRGGERGAVE